MSQGLWSPIMRYREYLSVLGKSLNQQIPPEQLVSKEWGVDRGKVSGTGTVALADTKPNLLIRVTVGSLW